MGDNVTLNFHKCYANPKFKEWIDSVLPEVEQCRRLEQDTPWHIYNCLDHILHSVEEINKLTQGYSQKIRKELLWTMFFHDLGKPKCHIRRYSEAFGREVDSFYNHNLESEKIFYRAAPYFGINANQLKLIGALIREHDAFLSITEKEDGNKHHKVLSKELIKEMVDKFNLVGDGVALMKELVLVAKADNLAQNPKLTQNSLSLINKIDRLVEELFKEQKSKKPTHTNLNEK